MFFPPTCGARLKIVEAALSSLLALAREPGVRDDLRARCIERVLAIGEDHYRWTVLEALDVMGPPARVHAPSVLALLKHENPRIRARAAESLGKMGLAEPDILEALERTADDNWAFVRDAVAQALRSLRQVEAQSLKEELERR